MQQIDAFVQQVITSLAFSREFLQFIVRHYGHALEFGNKYIYHCMPRMLSLWMDFGANIPEGSRWYLLSVSRLQYDNLSTSAN